MKKLFLMIATVALVASCTSNGNTSGSTSASGENKDGETTENTEEQKEVKDTLKGPATIDNPTWTVELPDGWQAPSVRAGETQKSSSYCELKPIVAEDGFKGPNGLRISSYPYKANTVDDSMESFLRIYKEGKKDGQVEINGVKFDKAIMVYPDGNTVTRLAAPLTPEGCVQIELSHLKYEDEIIKTILNSFKIKPAEAEAK